MEAVAKLNNNPTSTRKMRLLADLIRGLDAEKALNYFEIPSQTSQRSTGKAVGICYRQLESEERGPTGRRC